MKKYEPINKLSNLFYNHDGLYEIPRILKDFHSENHQRITTVVKKGN